MLINSSSWNWLCFLLPAHTCQEALSAHGLSIKAHRQRLGTANKADAHPPVPQQAGPCLLNRNCRAPVWRIYFPTGSNAHVSKPVLKSRGHELGDREGSEPGRCTSFYRKAGWAPRLFSHALIQQTAEV